MPKRDGSPTEYEQRRIARVDQLINRLNKSSAPMNPYVKTHLDQIGWDEFAEYWLKREDAWKKQGIIDLNIETFFRTFWLQDGKCSNPFCVSPPFLGMNDPMAMPDHCHYTRKFRGVLCGECNTMEGRLRIERRLRTLSEAEQGWFEKWSDQHLPSPFDP